MAARLFILLNIFWWLRLDSNSCHRAIAAGTIHPCPHRNLLGANFRRVLRFSLNGHRHAIVSLGRFGNLRPCIHVERDLRHVHVIFRKRGH
uniref:Putative secreted protein n=1 Tax=Ixodes ricinus TaxID=34613 RepID=A0A6B0UCF7_IXORI